MTEVFHGKLARTNDCTRKSVLAIASLFAMVSGKSEADLSAGDSFTVTDVFDPSVTAPENVVA